MLTRAALGFLGMFFMASALLLMFLTFLGGANNSNPLNIIYFLQADTSAIPGAPELSRWTFWNVCSVTPDGKSNCPDNSPAFPFDPPNDSNFGTTVNVPPRFVDTNHYFLMTRFMFAFMIIALFFGVVSFFTGFVSCLRIGGYLSGLLAHLALFFQTIVTALMTAVFVQARGGFSANGQTAKIGVKAYAFMWTAVACLFLSNVFYCVGGTVGGRESGYSGREHRRRGFFSNRRSSMRSNNKETNV